MQVGSSLIERAFSADDFRAQGHQLIDLVADYLSDVMHNEDAITIPWRTPEDQLNFWKDDFDAPPLHGPLDLFRNVLQRSVHLHSPRYMGHQTAATLPASVLSSLVVDVLNNGMGVYEMGMAGNAMEKIVTGHLAGKMGFDKNSSGFVTSGGSLGNLTALLAVRAIVAAESPDGQYCIFASQECHYSIDRAVRMLGGNIELIKVPVDECYKIKAGLLEERYQQEIAKGKKVLCVIGSACSTSTGSYDDLEALGKFCVANKIWFHVDAAHGGAAVFSPKYKPLLNGIEHANSVIIDFHKMMLTPSLSTAVIFKNGNHAFATFEQNAKYLWSDESTKEWYNSAKRTFECTKNMSILKVYTIFRLYGDDIFKAHVERLYDLAKEFAAFIKDNDHFELASEPESNIVCFRYKKEDADLNQLNAAIRTRLVEEGKFYIVETTIHQKLYLRLSLMNPLTSMKELKELVSSIESFLTFI